MNVFDERVKCPNCFATLDREQDLKRWGNFHTAIHDCLEANSDEEPNTVYNKLIAILDSLECRGGLLSHRNIKFAIVRNASNLYDVVFSAVTTYILSYYLYPTSNNTFYCYKCGKLQTITPSDTSKMIHFCPNNSGSYHLCGITSEDSTNDLGRVTCPECIDVATSIAIRVAKLFSVFNPINYK